MSKCAYIQATHSNHALACVQALWWRGTEKTGRRKRRGESERERERRGDALTLTLFPHSQFLLYLSSHSQTLLTRVCSQATHPLPPKAYILIGILISSKFEREGLFNVPKIWAVSTTINEALYAILLNTSTSISYPKQCTLYLERWEVSTSVV